MSFQNTIIQHLDNLDCVPSIIFNENNGSLFSIMFNIKQIGNKLKLFNITCQEEGNNFHFVSSTKNEDYVLYDHKLDLIEKDAFLNDKYGDNFKMYFSEFINAMYLIIE